MELKEGMKVRVRHDLKEEHCDYGIAVEMEAVRGKIFTIKKMEHGSIYLKDIAFNWKGDCFIPVDIEIDEDGNVI